MSLIAASKNKKSKLFFLNSDSLLILTEYAIANFCCIKDKQLTGMTSIRIKKP